MKKLNRWFLSGALVALFAFAAFAIHGCGGDDDNNPANPGGGGATADVTIDIVADMGAGAFGGGATVTVGQTVSWRNTRGTVHTSTQNGGEWDTGNIGINGGISTPIAMNNAGTFAYECGLHPSMTGTLTVNP